MSEAAQRPESRPDSPYAALRLGIVLLVMTLSASGMYVVPVVLSSVQAEFGVARADASLPYSMLMIGFGVGDHARDRFLGAGKTTLFNRILREQHGHRIAVIENEFGEAGIDNELLVQDSTEQIIEMNNGRICCRVRGDLIRILGELAGRREGALAFERVVIETTGRADPAPVAQTFFVDEMVSPQYRLDAIVTMVDAVHAPQQFDQHHEAQEQVGFADPPKSRTAA